MQGKLFILSFGLVCAGHYLDAQPAAIAGTAQDAVSHKPLGGVHVRLVLDVEDFSAATYGAMSDEFGRFSIATIPPGTYRWMPERAGFVDLGAATLTLKAGERRTDFTLEMTPQAVVAGHVVDENGDPVYGVAVEAVPVPGTKGKPGAQGQAMAGNTGDHGEFRIRGAPGKYRLRVEPGGAPAHRDDEGAVYAPTYYPGVGSEDRAGVLDAVGGRELTLSDIRLTQRHGLAIRGTVTGIPDAAAPVFVFARPSGGGEGFGGPTTVAGDGSFTFSGMAQGVYRLSAHYMSRKPQLRSRGAEVTLDSADVTNIELALLAGEELTGKVEGQGERAGSSIVLEPAAPRNSDMLQTGRGDVGKDGTFRIQDVFPGVYRVRVTPMEGNEYVKEVRLGGAPVSGSLDLSQSARGANLKVTVSPDGGEISGTVLAGDGQPPTSAANVLLVTAGSEVQHHATVTANSGGKYVIHGIPPGKYRLFVLDDSVDWGDGFDVLKPFTERAQEIDIAPAGRITKDLKLAAKEDADGNR